MKIPKKYQHLFKDHITIVGTRKEMETTQSSDPVWLMWEILTLDGVDEQTVKAINEVKRVFPGAILHGR